MAKGILTRRGGGAGEPTPPPSINFVSATGTSITFTITNNSIRDRDITYGLTTPPTTTTINIAANSTSAEQTISGLDGSTVYIIYAQAEDSIIVQVSVETLFEPIQATGGTVTDIEIEGIDYRVHSFTSVGTSTFNVQNIGSNGQIEYLIVAGGGGGGGVIGSGGGAGGLILDSVNLNQTNYTITVGDGGLGGTGWDTSTQSGIKGDDSSAFGLIAIGGGGGAYHGGASTGGYLQKNGGSGAGGTTTDGGPTGGTGLQPSSASGGLGNNGGTNINSSNGNHGAGGGGAGGAGGNTTSSSGGNGGVGYTSDITGTSVVYASGGAGAVRSGNGTPGTATGGGGFATSTSAKAGDGATNTGSGGGGAGYNVANSNRLGGKGGSGIVIIRYTLTNPN